MKLSIEIDDTQFGKNLQDRVDKAVAEMTSDLIKSRVEDILAVKFARLNDTVVMGAIDSAAYKMVFQATSKSYGDNIIREALARAATELLKDKVR